MPGHLTTYGANAILSGIAMPTTLYLAGHLGDPGVDADTSPAGETRRVSFGLDAPAGGATANGTEATLALATDSETWTHVSLWDASSGGNPWWVLELEAPVLISSGQTIRLAAAALSLSLTLWS